MVKGGGSSIRKCGSNGPLMCSIQFISVARLRDIVEHMPDFTHLDPLTVHCKLLALLEILRNT